MKLRWVWAFWLAVGLGAPARAQSFGLEGLETRLELRFSSALAVSAALSPAASWGLGAHLEARYTFQNVYFNLVLDPGVQFGTPLLRDAGLTEAFILLRYDTLDFSAGVERLPLETARLSLPFSLEPVSPLGARQGLPGARVSWSPEATRLRFVVLRSENSAFGLLSLRREFGGFELEGHTLLQHGQLTLGLGGSGTLDETVIYGEIWALGYPPDWRYALGLSGSLGDGTWTLEGGYAAPSVAEPVAHLLAGQLTLPQGEEISWNLSSKIVFVPGLWLTQLGASCTWGRDNQELVGGAWASFGPEPFALKLSLEARLYPER